MVGFDIYELVGRFAFGSENERTEREIIVHLCILLIPGSMSSYEAHLGLVCDLCVTSYLVQAKGPATKASHGSEHTRSRARPALIVDVVYDIKIDF